MAHKTKFVEVIELYIKSLNIRSVLFQRGRRVASANMEFDIFALKHIELL